jgi:hypothetical protein
MIQLARTKWWIPLEICAVVRNRIKERDKKVMLFPSMERTRDWPVPTNPNWQKEKKKKKREKRKMPKV